MNFDKEALKESVTDSFLGMPISIVLNYVMLWIGLTMGLGPIGLTVLITGVMFIVAVVRKYTIRIYFKQRNEDSLEVE